ncbi:hypothetical protein CSOJ01_05963 [Colletotrichum sojae]|uniref:Uncharacterized protein n=1 Tax=Colletotrichum sojae TaxID=2175907 RepID=A0A8H6MVV7_9PEZI|nr:hypothetical protein CSOJ01_05963 [Colletotrichum sojae]
MFRMHLQPSLLGSGVASPRIISSSHLELNRCRRASDAAGAAGLRHATPSPSICSYYTTSNASWLNGLTPFPLRTLVRPVPQDRVDGLFDWDAIPLLQFGWGRRPAFLLFIWVADDAASTNARCNARGHSIDKRSRSSRQDAFQTFQLPPNLSLEPASSMPSKPTRQHGTPPDWTAFPSAAPGRRASLAAANVPTPKSRPTSAGIAHCDSTS